MRLPEQIQAILIDKLNALHVEVEDESHLHAGHAGSGGGAHFNVVIVSSRFAGLPIMRQHRLVYDALAVQMQGAIHALSLKTYTPEQWQAHSSDG